MNRPDSSNGLALAETVQSSDADIIAGLDARLPRYTSYPTAPNFGDHVRAESYRTWLASLDAGLSLSLYLHVPFCEALCHYCGCHTNVANSPDRIAEYAELMIRELELVAETIGRRHNVSHIHWGGGTPAALAPAQFTAISRRIGRLFRIDAEAEIAVEIDPRHLGKGHLHAIAEAGVNRASLGVQDINPIVQRAIGRIQSFEQTAQAVAALRRVGVQQISLDLMYGLPHQTATSVANSVSTTLTLEPSRVCLFGYAHVPWMKKHQMLIPAGLLPDSVERLRQVRAAEAELAGAGYVAIGLDHYAARHDPLVVAQTEGRLHRNFQGYTTDAAPALIGLGASSIGSLPQGYVQNTPNLKAYREAIERGQFATARGIELSRQDRIRRTIIERLMCDLGVDLADVSEMTDPSREYAPELESLSRLATDGLITIEGTKIRVPERMRPFVRKVAAVFDSYLHHVGPTYSRAV